MKRLITIPLLFLTFKVDSNELKCITEAVYHEARGGSLLDQKKVIYVILNRIKSKKFPNSACRVVNQKGQFTYKRKKITDIKSYNKIYQLVKKTRKSKTNHLYFKKCGNRNCFR